MTSPFRSIVAAQPPNVVAEAIEQAQEPATLESMIAGLLARPPSSSQSTSPIANLETSSRGPATGMQAPIKRSQLHGGIYSEADAVALLNSHYFIGKSKQETAIFRINDDGSIAFVPNEQFRLEVQNIFVQGRGSAKPVPVEKYWKESPHRHERELVFRPGGTAAPNEFNLWHGFGVELRKGWQKQRRFLRHLRRVICRRDKRKFKYLMRLLAWFVQNPDKHAGVVLVLKSREQGTGKSTVGKVMLDIFGRHGFLVDDKERLLGRFADWLETACFVLAEEILFAGDLKSADKMKSMVTGDVLQVERKFGSCRQVPNRMKVIATTNHEHAIAAGVRDRRYVVYDVSNEHVGDGDYFEALYHDLADGGTSEFLWLLLSLQLGNWHPRAIIKTDETTEQQRMSGDSVSQWAQACVVADAVIGVQGPLRTLDLGQMIASEHLRAAYAGYCRQQGLRPIGESAFGKACVEMFGPRKRLPATHVADLGATAAQGTEDFGAPSDSDEALDQRISDLMGKHPLGGEAVIAQAAAAQPGQAPATSGRSRPWGYHVPLGEGWQERIDARLGLRQ